MKTEVYSWRVTPELKRALEEQARRRGSSVAGLLEEIAQGWLSLHENSDTSAEQTRRHRAARRWFGAIELPDPGTSENVRRVVRERLQKGYGRSRSR